MKRYKAIYVASVIILVGFICGIVFVCNYYNDYSHFGDELTKYLDYTYTSKNELMVTVNYNNKNYYLGADEIGYFTSTILRGGLLSRRRVYFDKGKDYENDPKVIAYYDEATLTLYNIAKDKEEDVCFLKYDKKNGGTTYYRIEGLQAFKNTVGCLRLVNQVP